MAPNPLTQVEDEIAILGTIISEPPAIKSVADILRPEHLYQEFNREVYSACLSLYRDGIEIDPISVADRYLRSGSRNFPTIKSTIAGLALYALPSYSLARHHAEILIDLHKRREATTIHRQSIHNLEDLAKPLNSLLSSSTEQLFALAETGDGGLSSLSDEALPEALRRLEAARKGDGDTGVVPWFANALTGLSPLRRGEVTVVCGRPGMAKTSLALNAAVYAAKKGIPVGIFSLEMNKATLAFRLMSTLARVDSRLIEKGEIDDEQHQAILEAITELKTLPIHIDDNPDLDEIGFMSKARAAQQKEGIGLFILDYLQLMTRRNHDSDVAAVGSCARTIRKTARILQVPIIEVCQVSRNCEYREDKRPRLSDLRESGEIEQEADIVLALYREEYYDRDSPDKYCEVNVLKHRNGALGQIKLVFMEKITKFEEVHPMFYGSRNGQS